MYRVLVALLCACAGSLVVASTPPPYSEARAASHKSFKHILEFLDCPIANREQLNFAVLALAFDAVGISIANGNDYDQVYSIIDSVIKLAELEPEAARKAVLDNVYKALKKEEPITRLIDEQCCPGSLDGTTGRKCDELVDSVVQQNPWYQPYATVLLDNGKFGQLFKENQADIGIAIKEDKVQEYFECNKCALKPLFFQISELVLNREKCN